MRKQELPNAAKVQIAELEIRLQAALDASSKADEALLQERQDRQDEKQAWREEKSELKDRIKKLEEELKSERRRSAQALDVAESSSDAAGGIGRLLHSLMNHDTLETLRLENDRRQREHQERMRHRRPG